MMICLTPRTGVIYIIKCNKTGEVYIGSSWDMYNRISSHKNKQECSSKNIIKNGDYQFIELFSVNVYSHQELKHYERKIIRFYKNKNNNLCVNEMGIYEDKIKERRQEYDQIHKDKIKQQKKDWYERTKSKK
jgi:predicted GIY-YIG superfamily endonuclease